MLYERVLDPAHTLSPLRQAYYILKCISEGRTREEIVYLNTVSLITNEGYAFLKTLHKNAISSKRREAVSPGASNVLHNGSVILLNVVDLIHECGS